MAKIFEVDYRNGSTIEKQFSLVPINANNTILLRSPKGYVADFNTALVQNLLYGATAGIVTTNDFSIEIWGIIKSGTGTRWLFRHGGSGAIGYAVYVNNATGQVSGDIYDGASTGTAFSSVSAILDKPFHLIINYDRDGNATLYYNNTLERTVFISNRPGTLASSQTNFIGSASSLGDPSNSQVFKAIVRDTLMTKQELNASYAEFIASKPIAKPKRGFIISKPTDLKNVSGLIAAYNMTQKNGLVTDISGNNLNGTIGGNVVSSINGLSSPLNGYISCPSLSLEGDFSISWRMKTGALGSIQNIFRQAGYGSSNVWIFISAVNYLAIDQNTGGSFSVSSGATYTGEEATFTITFVSSTHTVQFYKNGAVLGSAGTTYNPSGSRTAIFNMLGINATETAYTGRGELQDLRIHNKILTLQEIKDYHNLFVKPVLIEDFSNEPADGVAMIPQGWQ